MIFQNWQYRTLRVQRLNAKGKMPVTHVFDVIRRPDTRKALLIETWGGFNKGYCKVCPSEAEALVYMGKRLNKIVRPADADIGLGDMKDGQTRIETETGHIRVVHSGEFDAELENGITKMMTERFTRLSIPLYSGMIGYDSTGWNSTNNLYRVLERAEEVDANATMMEVCAALICRISLNMEADDDIHKIATSLAEIEEWCKPMRDPGEEKMFPGDFDKGFAMAANMIRKHSPISGVLDTNPKETETVLTEEEVEMMHSKQYTSWGAWS